MKFNDLGPRLRVLRKRKMMSLRELASSLPKELRVTGASISRWENGQDFPVSRLFTMADAFGLRDVAEIFSDSPPSTIDCGVVLEKLQQIESRIDAGKKAVVPGSHVVP
jgi:transcriptional regulator with XRE-family HTH domain